MNDFLNNNITEKLKKILKENMEPNSSILEYSNAKLYISYDNSEDFEYTNLEGYLCLVINRQHSCLFIQLYDYVYFKKEFEIELYTNIDKGYSVLNDLFHSIEFPNFFIGINFSNKITAEKMKIKILYNSMILNYPTKLLALPNSTKIETDNEKILNQTVELPGRDNIQSLNKIVTFYINREENNVVFDLKREDFESNFTPLGLYVQNFDAHKKKIISNIKQEEKLNILNTVDNKNKFIEFDHGKKKSISNIESFNSDNKELDKENSSKHSMQMQNKVNHSDNEPKTMQDEIKQGIKLKSLPKNIGEKKPLKVQHLSNNPQLQAQMKYRMENKKISENTSENEDD